MKELVYKGKKNTLGLCQALPCNKNKNLNTSTNPHQIVFHLALLQIGFRRINNLIFASSSFHGCTWHQMIFTCCTA